MSETVGSAPPAGEPHRPGTEPDRPAAAAGARPADGGWRLWLPPGVDAGIHGETPGDASGLVHAGDNWAGAGHEIPRHTHAAWEFYLQLHGGSTWDVGRHSLRLAPGWLVAVPPGTPHRGSPRAREGGRHHYAYAAVDLDVVGARHPSIAAAWHGRPVLWSAQARDLAPAFRSVVAEIAEQRPFGPVALTAAVDLLTAEVSRSLLSAERPNVRTVRHPAVARARQLLDHQYAGAWTVDDLAAACSLSRTRLSELFTAEVGQPPYRYLLERRVERAAELLATTPYTVAEVAAAVGFGSHVQLARRFRQVLGMSPTEWRRRRSRPSPRQGGRRSARDLRPDGQ